LTRSAHGRGCSRDEHLSRWGRMWWGCTPHMSPAALGWCSCHIQPWPLAMCVQTNLISTAVVYLRWEGIGRAARVLITCLVPGNPGREPRHETGGMTTGVLSSWPIETGYIADSQRKQARRRARETDRHERKKNNTPQRHTQSQDKRHTCQIHMAQTRLHFSYSYILF